MNKVNNMNNKEKENKNIFKVLKDKFILAPFKYLAVFVAGVVFASGLVYAWNAIWHGTDWIQSGAVIESKKLAESLQYLYDRKADKPNFPECSGRYNKLEIKNNKFVCTDVTPKGCKLRYKIKTSSGESDWVETEWGAKNGGNWVYGPAARVKGNPATISYKVGIMCDEYSGLELGYRFRGNHGPYSWNSVGNTSYDGKVSSGQNTWNYGKYTTPFSKSCNIKGGDGGCGMVIREISESGLLNCDTMIRYNKDQWKPGGWSPGYESNGYGSSSASTGCSGKGCSIEMAIRCR